MPRESHALQQMPTDGKTDIPYPDYRTIVNSLLLHGGDFFMGAVTGAGGAGGALAAIPFEPAVVVAINQGGATPALHVSAYATAAAHMSIAAAAAANANPAVITDNGDGTFDLTLTTQMAPDGEVVTVIVIGFRDAGGSQ